MSPAQGWEVVCAVCGELRWPYGPPRPDPYTCTRCRSGAGQAKRESGKKEAASRKAQRQHPATGEAV